MNSPWFILGCCFILLEIGHPGLLYFLALASGSFTAFVASYFDYSVEMQNIVFFVTTLLAIALVYFFLKITYKESGFYRSHVDQLLGQIVKITIIQTTKVGLGKVGGETWSVKLQGEGQLEVGMKAIIIGIQGCHLQVQLIKND